jgi:CheY-like chemotaxis protein
VPQEAHDEATAPKPNTSLDILVVEDNATNRIVLEEMLLHLGHRVTLAADGGEGMVLAQARRFDVILMDVSMPIMDGLTATEMIRYDGLSKTSRIIGVTAHSMPEDQQRFKAAGMDDYLTKPISKANLSRAIAGQPEHAAPKPVSKIVLDAERIAELQAAMGTAGLQRVITRALQDLPAIWQRLQDSAAEAQLSNMLAASHEAAGSCAMIGATDLRHNTAQIEELCRDGDLPRATAILSGSADLWRITEEQLRLHLLQPASG